MQRQGKFGSRKEQKGTRRKKGAGQETGGENREKIGSKAGKDREGKEKLRQIENLELLKRELNC